MLMERSSRSLQWDCGHWYLSAGVFSITRRPFHTSSPSPSSLSITSHHWQSSSVLSSLCQWLGNNGYGHLSNCQQAINSYGNNCRHSALPLPMFKLELLPHSSPHPAKLNINLCPASAPESAKATKQICSYWLQSTTIKLQTTNAVLEVTSETTIHKKDRVRFNIQLDTL